MNINILNSEVQDFINEHLDSNLESLILKGASFEGVSIQTISAQIQAKKKCQLKLKTWYNTAGIYFPNKINIEQTSSEVTAQFKAELVDGKSLIDLTGGFGVDSYYFSKHINKVTHCEVDSRLSKIACHNFKTLRVNNINSVCGDGLNYLKICPNKYDWIYIDPSRRSQERQKVFFIEDCTPNLTKYQKLLHKKANNILIKLSPMLDVQQAVKSLQYVKTIYIVAINNEVKELLFHIKSGYKEVYNIKAVNIGKAISKTFEFTTKDETLATPSYSIPQTYLFEPNVAILKSGAFKLIAQRFNIKKLDTNTHLYTSQQLIDNFPGNTYKIDQLFDYNKRQLKPIIGGKKFNVKTRNFPLSVDQLRKQFKLKDGGENYLFFVTSAQKKYALLCQK